MSVGFAIKLPVAGEGEEGCIVARVGRNGVFEKSLKKRPWEGSGSSPESSRSGARLAKASIYVYFEIQVRTNLELMF